jgi:hypothetical protein
MTLTELETLIREQLTAAGLWSVVDQYKSQFLEFPDGFFVEIVLNDAAKLVDVERVFRVEEVSRRLDGTELHAMVRANWEVQSVEGPKPAIIVPGGIRPAWAFTGRLVGGGLKTEVEVDVTMSAVDAIKRNIAGPVQEAEAIKEVVKEFLKLRLSYGGESYWDPLRENRIDLSDDALSYWFPHSMAGKS